MDNALPSLLYLYDETASFSPTDELKRLFSVTTLLYGSKPDLSTPYIGIVLETKKFGSSHVEYLESLFQINKSVLVLIASEIDEACYRKIALQAQCVHYTPLSENLNETVCKEIIPMLQAYMSTLHYNEALKLRSHRSGMVDTLNVVAHQWRQPINLISMEAINLSIQSTLEECVPSASIQKSTKMISEQSQRMAEILKNVLNMGKTHRGKEPFSINEMLERVELFFTDLLERERIYYQTLKLKEDKFLYGYSSDLEEVLVNLIANAKDAFKSIATEYTKTISVEVSSNDTAFIFLVKDNAGGIPEAIREKIFEPHFSTKGKGEGFGIGLHIARLIITQEFKGTLDLSVSDNQTTFIISIPRSDASQLKFIYS